MVDIALKSLFHHKVRFAITLAGVAFAVTLVLSQVGLFLGLLDNASVTIERCNADLWVSSKGSPNVDFGHAFSERYVDRIRAVDGVDRADNLIVTFLPVVQPSGAEVTTIVYAMNDFRPWGLPWDVVDGNVDDLRRGANVLVDASAAKTFGVFDTGDFRETHGHRIRIVGHTRGALSFTTYPMMFLDASTVHSILPDLTEGKTTFVVVKLKPDADIQVVRRVLRQRLPHHDVWTAAEWRQQSRDYWVITTGLGLNILVTVALGCLVGLVIVAQTLYTSTLEHIGEFATLKAIGGSNLDIYRILTKQAVLCAVLGFVVGVLPVLVMRALVPLAGLQLLLPAWLIGAVFAGALALCLLSAMASFRKIAAIDPALVFRG